MKKLLTAGVAAGVAAVSLLPNVAQAAPQLANIEAGRVRSFGHAPSTDVVLRLNDLYKHVRRTVNGCGFIELNSRPNGANQVYYRWTAGAIQAGNTATNATMAISEAPRCVNGQLATALPTWTLSSSLPRIYRTPDNRFFQTDLTPGAIAFTAKVTAGAVEYVDLKAKSNACGVASHNLSKSIQTYGTTSAWADNGMPIEILGESQFGNIVSASALTDDEGNPRAIATPLCAKMRQVGRCSMSSHRQTNAAAVVLDIPMAEY